MPYTLLIRTGGIALILGVVVFLIYRHAYNRGVEDKVAYYEPILRQAADDKIAADERATAAEQRSVKITEQVEQSHAEMEKSLTDRALSAEQRIADLLRERAAPPSNRRLEVSTLPGGAPQRADPAPSDERDQRFAASVSSVARQCEHDASELAEWQKWYDRQRSSLTQLAED